MKIFQKNVMQSEDIGALLVTGKFYAEGKEASCHDGALVEVGALENHGVYAGLKDLNTRRITAPTANTTVYGFVDYVGRSQGLIYGVEYREGIKTAGLVAPEGAEVRVRYVRKNDTFYLGTDNFIGTPAVGKYAVPTANDTRLTIVEEAPTEGFYVEIETTKALTEGATDTDTLYFCNVKRD